jgi:hypothetical protein
VLAFRRHALFLVSGDGLSALLGGGFASMSQMPSGFVISNVRIAGWRFIWSSSGSSRNKNRCAITGWRRDLSPEEKHESPSLPKVRFPATFDELEAAGYAYTGTAKECDCGMKLLWFITPARKWMAFSALKDSKLVPHVSICARAMQLRAANKVHEDRMRRELGLQKPKQEKLF